ncbi:MAG: AGE family epimerase/isomerase [Chthonomonadales bacterium]|nr:AGE family epimerase/isomerase [Chthonomonadales bacterium]
MPHDQERTATGWFRAHLLDELLPRWLDAAVTPEGLYLPRLDRQWRRTGGNHGTLVSQSRLLFNFACGYRASGDARYAEAAAGGASLLLEHFRDRRHGGFFWSCALDGAVRDDHKSTYGHAFALLALASAFGALGDRALVDAAAETWGVVRRRFAEAGGGWLAGARRDFGSFEDMRSQNPVMHLFEALLALAEHTGAREWLDEAGAVARFVTARLIGEPGRPLPEVYSAAWEPLPADRGGRVDLGHQVEWAWLLSRAVELGLDASLLPWGEALLDWGLRVGIDPVQGGLNPTATPEGVVSARTKGWWQQCEAARAMLHWEAVRGRGDVRPTFEATMRLVRERFLDSVHGGWYMHVGPDGAVRNTDKGTDWKLDYHVTGLCMEAMRLAGA